MSVHEVTYYQAKCDGCGHIEDDYGDFSAWSDPGSPFDSLPDAGWLTSNSRDLCENCVRKEPCEVCKAVDSYIVDEHIVCEEHEGHEFATVAAS
jgi:hypothetical protein